MLAFCRPASGLDLSQHQPRSTEHVCQFGSGFPLPGRIVVCGLTDLQAAVPIAPLKWVHIPTERVMNQNHI